MNTTVISAAALPSSPIKNSNLPSRSYWRLVGRQILRDPVISAALLLLIIGAAVFAPWLAPADPYKASMLRRLLPIGSPGFPLGSDELGRDMLARLMYGGRLSLLMGAVPVLIAFLSAPRWVCWPATSAAS